VLVGIISFGGDMAKILVVDDSKLIVAMLTDVLSSAGHEVKAAYNGAEAIAELRKEKPDLIFMDIQMPGIDGHTTAKLISMDKKFERTPIIVFSSLKSPEMMELSKKVGAVIHLNKDASKEKILYTVDEALKISDPGSKQS